MKKEDAKMSVTVAEYLFKRLTQLGVGSMHGVPGDFNLTLLDYVEPAGIRWVGNTNELNAGYAADGYARTKGLGALITTFGVGELSAINAIAGAYAERAPVVHIVGVPGRPTQDGRVQVHHTFNDGEFGRFAKMHAHVTVAQTKLWDTRTAAEQIDSTLAQCLIHSRPVYIEVPVDVVDVRISDQRLSAKIEIPTIQPSSSPSHDAAVAKLQDKIAAAKQPVILVDGETRAMGVTDEVRDLVKATGWPTWTTGFAKSIIDESLPNFHGLYRGTYDSQKTQDFFGAADLVLCFGPHFSGTNSFIFASLPDAAKTVSFSDSEINFCGEVVRDLAVKHIIRKAADDAKASAKPHYAAGSYPDLPKDSLLPFSTVQADKDIKQESVWRVLGNFFREGDIIMAETGTASYGIKDAPLPKNTQLFSAVTWLSIGYMLPAAQGAALAQRELAESGRWHGVAKPRTVLIIGDGSFQLTAQELSTIIAHNLNVAVFVINNDGYTIERCIHGVRQRYNDVARWRYMSAPQFFGAPEGAFTRSVRKWGELEEVLGERELADGEGLRMVEIIMDKEDAPVGPLAMLMDKQHALLKK